MARAVGVVVFVAVAACGAPPGSATSDAGGLTTGSRNPAGDAPVISDGGADDGGPSADRDSSADGEPSPGSDSSTGDASVDGEPSAVSAAPDGGAPASRFVTGIVSYTPGGCAGFGQGSAPGIVEGPPVGGGTEHGSLDVLSLGGGGTLVVTFAPNAIVDGPGPDFIVFENPFWIGGNASNVYAEPGEVSVSDDGVTWVAFPCTPVLAPGATDGTGTMPPYGDCAGWGVVYSAPGNGISPFDPGTAGGNAYDLTDVGLTHARYVRIADRTEEACPEAGPDRPTTNGFDLDAIAIVNAELP